MLSGRRLDLLDPSPLDIEIEDIAHGLSRVARWNGQTLGDYPFSVAAHSLLVEAIVGHIEPNASPGDRLAALLHDAPEYVVGDLISPFKAAVGGPYRAIEDRLWHAIRLRFGLPDDADGSQKALIKRADRTAAYCEAVTLAGFSQPEALTFFGEPAVDPAVIAATVTTRPTVEVASDFLRRYQALQTAHDEAP